MSQKVQVKIAGESVYLGEMTGESGGLCHWFLPLYHSPTLDKGLNSEHPVSRGAKFGQLAKNILRLMSSFSLSPHLSPLSSSDFQLSNRHEVECLNPKRTIISLELGNYTANLYSCPGDKPLLRQSVLPL
jgi:hypothetical protein